MIDPFFAACTPSTFPWQLRVPATCPGTHRSENYFGVPVIFAHFQRLINTTTRSYLEWQGRKPQGCVQKTGGFTWLNPPAETQPDGNCAGKYSMIENAQKLALVPLTDQVDAAEQLLVYEKTAAKILNKMSISHFREMVDRSVIPYRLHRGRTKRLYFVDDLRSYVKDLRAQYGKKKKAQ
jgi:hypothetical protein